MLCSRRVKFILLQHYKDDVVSSEEEEEESEEEVIADEDATEEPGGFVNPFFSNYYGMENELAAEASVERARPLKVARKSLKPAPKSGDMKATEGTANVMRALRDAPAERKPFFGPGSSDFNVLEHYRDIAPKKAFRDLSKIEIEALKVAATASHGWKASSAGPETIFSRAGLICTALRNSLSPSTIELLVFLSKNADDQPSGNCQSCIIFLFSFSS